MTTSELIEELRENDPKEKGQVLVDEGEDACGNRRRSEAVIREVDGEGNIILE